MADLTIVQSEVLRACLIHSKRSPAPITGYRWYLTRSPFTGGAASFNKHLRDLEKEGFLREAEGGGYHLTQKGETAGELI